MNEDTKMLFGHWKTRGYSWIIQYMSEFSDAPYEFKYYEQGEGLDYDKSAWTSVKHTLGLEFPNLPYMFVDDFKLTESIAILTYIAAKYKPELLGETPEEKGEVTMVTNVIHDM